MQAFGAPGIEPRWTRGNKDGVGTAYSSDSKLWFTLWNGTVTEVYYPTVDRPQLRDLELLITDGVSFFHEEKRHLDHSVSKVSEHALGYVVRNSDKDGRYSIEKKVITNPHAPSLIQHVKLEGNIEFLSKLKLYVLCAPHLEVGGWGNTGRVAHIGGRSVLTAEKNGVWLALAASLPFSKTSVGYVGASDGWTDISSNLQMDWEFDEAPNGNIALTGELVPGTSTEFDIVLAMGESYHHALTVLFQTLASPFSELYEKFVEQWDRACEKMLPLGRFSGDGENLYSSSYSLLLAHEDKTYPGAIIASLSIPWGESKSDDDQGGYHLVWTRDLVSSVTGLLAAGNRETALKALVYLGVSQLENGGFPQNFWIDGDPYWRGVQLDEAAFPIILAWKLDRDGLLWSVDPYPMIMKAAAFIIREGPVTQQDRWEEASGYSPSTLAATISSLICAAEFARKKDNQVTARFLEEYADFLESHIEDWTVTKTGKLVPGISRHYIRITPANPYNPVPTESPDTGQIVLANQPPGERNTYPANEIVDGGFLELVRYGIRRPDDPVILDSVKVLDSVLRVETPSGPCWHRYNHDGYGQGKNGLPYEGYGIGRAWPLLTGERGMFELISGRPALPYLRALENFASSTGLIPEQVWDEEDLPAAHMYKGGPTGSAMPLMWAHAEYLKLLRSIADGKGIDVIQPVAERYANRNVPREGPHLEIWKPNRQPPSIPNDSQLRILGYSPFTLHWSGDNWKNPIDQKSQPTSVGIHYVDIKPSDLPRDAKEIKFTFQWMDSGAWEGRDYTVELRK